MFRRRRVAPAEPPPAPTSAPVDEVTPELEQYIQELGERLPAPAATRDDESLVRAAQAGDLDAFNILVQRHERPVFNVALRLLRDVGLWRQRSAGIAYMAIFVAVAPLSLLAASQLAVATEFWGVALALAAGALLYVVAGSLVPRVEHLAREQIGPVLLTFVVAVLVSIGVQLAAPHDELGGAPAHAAPRDGH